MFRSRAVFARFAALAIGAVVLYAAAATPASAEWFVGGTHLLGSAALATTASVDESFKLKAAGVTLECKGSTLNAAAAQIESIGEMATASSLTFTECAASGSCTATKSIGTAPLLLDVGEAGKTTLLPRTKTILATIKYEGETCALLGVQPVTGKAAVNMPTLEEERTLQLAEATVTEASGELKVGSSPAELKGKALLKLASGQPFAAKAAKAKPPAPPRLEQVNFTNNLPVKIDHTKNEFPQEPIAIEEYEGKEGEAKDAIEWKSPKAGEVIKNWPIAYVQGTKVKLEVKLALEAATQLFLETEIEGEPVLTGETMFGGTLLKFEKKFNAAAIKANKGFLATGVIEAANALPGKALYALAPIVWKWEYKEKGKPATKENLGNTTHNLYSIFAAPLGGKELYLTVLDLDTVGIEKEAVLNEEKTIAGAWRGFSNFEGAVPSVHIRTYNPASATGELGRAGKVLQYYGEIVAAGKNLTQVYEEEITKGKRLAVCSGQTTREILKGGVGRCGGWANMWIEALGSEGVASESIHLLVKFGAAKAPCATAFVCIMLVKNWSFGVMGLGEFPYETNQVKDEEGIPGQGVKNPPPFFWDHAIVKAGPEGAAMLYDPSYGKGPFPGTEVVEPATPKSVLEEYQKKSIDGFCRSTEAEQEEVEKGEKFGAAPIECQKTPAALELAAEAEFEFP